MTERLYFTDSHLLAFDATVVDVLDHEGRRAVVLDRTAFYPTGGGQPNDAGTIGPARVVDVLEDDGGRVLHVVEDAAPAPGETLSCTVDASRRRDHLQQHTGQHVLSQAFVQLYGAETRGFRMNADSSEIDVALDDPSPEKIERAEQLANDVVFADRPVRIHVVDAEGAKRLPLRKESAREGDLRVIEIEDYDWSPCGGTHAQRTGEIGLIVVKSFERAKGMLRVEFLAGARALADYRAANRLALDTARALSTGRDEAPELVRRQAEENKLLRRRVRDLAEIASEVEGRSLFDDGEDAGGHRLVARRLDGRSADELRMLTHKILASGEALVLLGSDDGGAARLVFARSEGVAADCGAMMRAACEALGGRGGGKPDMAQGGAPDAARLDDAIAAAKALASF